MARGWHSPSIDESCASALAQALGVRPLTARLLVRRGVLQADHGHRFLQPKLAELRAPAGIADLQSGIDRMAHALETGQLIGVFGDYDVDGVTSAAVLTSALRALGARVLPRCASRHAGYGFGLAAAEAFLAAGCAFVITADCGTSDHKSIAFLKEKGIDVMVIDHHQVPEGKSAAVALINPHRGDDRFEFKGLASCGLAFYLMAALRSHLRSKNHAAAAAWDPRELLDLVAMGTIADVMPLTDENRVLVSAGLKTLSARTRPGVAALFNVAGLQDPRPVTATDIGFRLAPRLNAAGRLGDAQLALDLLLAVDPAEAERLALLLDEQNRQRQQIQETVLSSALAQVESMIAAGGGRVPWAIVVGDEGWHHGVVGIVAAKLVDKYARPTIVVGFHEGKGRGSARTVAGFNLYQALAASAPHLEVYGGHAAAAGMTVLRDRFEAFRQSFTAHAEQWFGLRPPHSAVEVDAVVSLSELDLACAEELARLGPFGAANSEPILAFENVTIANARVVSGTHLQLTLGQNGAMAEAMGFNMADVAPVAGQVMDVVACFEINDFRGTRRPRLRVKHLLSAAPVGEPS
ncbi:MAG: single-stranded-DNA-specific exonuclease RecJ [Deltaproteobacteria bacterium]|nr:single-stranded-DNA-specific exonuclease RecJ [Deltaproteobacteria bacterium]